MQLEFFNEFEHRKVGHVRGVPAKFFSDHPIKFDLFRTMSEIKSETPDLDKFSNPEKLDVGIVHDWFPGPGLAGGERVVEQMVKTFPNCTVYSLFDFLSDDLRQEVVGERGIKVSRLNKLPKVASYYRYLLLSCTRAIEEFDVTQHDLVLTSSAAIAKGVITAPGQPHLAYVHSPARYAWDLTHEYISSIEGFLAPIKQEIARRMMHKFRIWDMRTPQSIDLMIANSKFIAKRVEKVYGRRALVLYPPVDTTSFDIAPRERDSFYLTASRMVPYKKIDLIVQAFRQTPTRRLVVIGDGPEMSKIKSLSTPNIEILGYQPFEVLRDHMQRAKAFVFAANEDFGIIPVEAQACGTPVIALGQGGTAETIRPIHLDKAPTGVWFSDQSVEAIRTAIDEFEKNEDSFDPGNCRKQALYFGADRFRRELTEIVKQGQEVGYRNLVRGGLQES